MKTHELFTLLEDLETVNNLKGIKFNSTIDKNRELIESETGGIKKHSKPSPEFENYDNARLEILQKYANKDDNGQPIYTQNEGFVKFDIPPEKQKNLESDVAKLVKEYDRLLLEDVKLEFKTFTLEDLDDNITGDQYKIIKLFLSE